MNDKINEFLKLVEEIERHKKAVIVEPEPVIAATESNENNEEVVTEETQEPQVDNIAEFLRLLQEIDRQKRENAPIVEEKNEELNEVVEVKPEEVVTEENKISALSKHFKKSKKKKQEQLIEEAPEDPLLPLSQKFVTLGDLNKHYNTFLQRIQQQLTSLGGGGEVNFRYLDDVNRFTMTPTNDNWVLEYDVATGKVQFTNKIGPVDYVRFDINHTHEEERVVGTLCWDPLDQTLNIAHPGGVTQQVGQVSYALVRNRTGSTILNGTPVMFAGAEEDLGFGSRLLVAPIVANGTFTSLYGLGVASQDILDDGDGLVIVWGKLKNVNTSAFNIGDVLYADPFSTGGLTNIKPTAPNNVIPFAAVLSSNTTSGEIFVRPTIEQRQYFGRFSKLNDATANGVNVATPIVFETTDISNGIIMNGPSNTEIQVADSGYYQFDLDAQVTATSNKGIVYFWFKKNNMDVPHSTRSTTITNGDTFHVSITTHISLDIGDVVEIFWARSAEGIFLDARNATAFAPSSASTTVNVTQIQL